MFSSRYFVGYGIDIGGGRDSLKNQITKFPAIKSIRNWDMADGDAQYLAGVDNSSFDFIYSSHCLEHLTDPSEAIKNWLRVLRPGGYLIVTVPDEDMYENGIWPSPHNVDHKWSFTVYKRFLEMPKSINVVDLVSQFSDQIDCERLIKVKDHYFEHKSEVDQTLGSAECAIEFIWQKRESTINEVLQQASLYEAQGQLTKAIELYGEAIKRGHFEFNLYNQLSNLLVREKRIAEAEGVWNACIQSFPELHAAHLYRALFLISIGKYDEGFALRDPLVSDGRRTAVESPKDCRRWHGESLCGKSIVIWTEFGFGDEIMFARFVTVFKQHHKASHVSIVCQKPLFNLFKTLSGVDLVVSDDDIGSLKPHDYWVFPHSIPVFHSLEKYGFSVKTPYFDIPNKLIAAENRNFSPKKSGRLRVGFVSNGSPTHENDQLRSINNLKVFESIFRLPGIDWIDLQKGADKNKFSELRLPVGLSIKHPGPHLTDFLQTGAICSQLDLLISVDTSVVHLAGALNVPVWLMLPTYADWRWGVNQTSSSWYSSVHIFRQKDTGNWADVAGQIHDALCEKLMSISI